MRKNNKNGFTIVEIVIVIAVIAILAAVLIPTFANIIKKANQSVDEQLVNNLNKILTTEEAINGKNLFMHEAVLDLKEYGYELDALKMSDSDFELVWDQRVDRFVIIEKPTSNYTKISISYCSKSDEGFYEEHYNKIDTRLSWKIYTKDDYVKGKDGYPDGRLPNDAEAMFSIYWGEKDTAPIVDNNGTFNVGLDLGYYDGTFEFTAGSTDNPEWLVFNTENVRVRGNFNGLQFNGTGAYHIGDVGNLILNMTSKYSSIYDPNATDYTHHEYGEVEMVKLNKTSLGKIDNQNVKLIAESGSKFDQSKTNVESAVGGAAHFEDRGATFGTN